MKILNTSKKLFGIRSRFNSLSERHYKSTYVLLKRKLRAVDRKVLVSRAISDNASIHYIVVEVDNGSMVDNSIITIKANEVGLRNFQVIP